MAIVKHPRTVQSLLSFPGTAILTVRNDIFPIPCDRPVEAHDTSKSPPDLPSELWQMILSSLGNFSIKKFRLVHPHWALIGAPYLFRTVYLTVHPNSVDSLIQIAGSSWASFVNELVWSPLALSSDCLEAKEWRATYQNLLANVKHGELVKLHQVYRRLFRDQTDARLNDQTSNLATVIGKLVNCREFSIQDGVEDVESACSDAALRSAIQKSSLFHRASIWVTNPRQGSLYSTLTVKSCIQIIAALQNSPVISIVTVACRECLWAKVIEALINSGHHRYQSQRQVYRSAFVGVRWLCLALKRTIDRHRQACSLNPEVSLQFLGSFELPELVHLTLRMVPEKKRIFDEMTMDDRGDPDTDCESGSHDSLYDELISDSQPTQSMSNSSTSGHAWGSDDTSQHGDKLDPVQYYRAFVEETTLILGLVRFPKLEKLSVANVLIDTDLFLAWCWFQPRLPRSKLTIEIAGVVIFDEMALEDFLAALASLNVELAYDCQNTGYYERSQWSHKLSTKNYRMVVDSKRFRDMDGWIDYVQEKRALHTMPSMAELPMSKPKILLQPNRTESLRGYSCFYRFSEWHWSEPDDEYILDFWEDALYPVASADDAATEEVDWMDLDEQEFCQKVGPGGHS